MGLEAGIPMARAGWVWGMGPFVIKINSSNTPSTSRILTNECDSIGSGLGMQCMCGCPRGEGWELPCTQCAHSAKFCVSVAT